MKSKLLNLLLIITSLFGYLEWGKDNSTFLFQAEYELFTKLISGETSVLHPFVVIPFLGQLLLLITLFQKKPGKVLIYTGIACLGLLLVFIFFIGIISFNFKILISALPFIIVSTIVIRDNKKQ